LPKIKEKTMANKRFCLGMLVMVLAFGMSVVGCDDSLDENDGGKSITVTGITGKTGDAMIMAFSSMDENGIVAMGMGKISSGSVSFSLIKDERMNPFTGSGSYFLMLQFDVDDSQYVYSNGKTWAELGITGSSEDEVFSKLPKYNISSATSTIPFSKFNEIPDEDW
jgi:hypothetical protein